MLPFAAHCATVQKYLEVRCGIKVVTRDIPDPLTGDLDGAEIHIDHAVTAEERLFLLAHLFGHTVQWNVVPGAFDIGQLHPPPVEEGLLARIVAYERDAAGYSLAMLHSAGVTDADQWLSDYTATDMAYLQHYYRTGEKREFRSFWIANAPLVKPIPVPAFTPASLKMRVDGIVI
jgi:hypothetical protein